MTKKPTMNDVARLARVGRGTVSNYINGQKVKIDNRIKIEKAIKKLGYVPNLQARALKTATNKIVVFVVPTNWTPFFSEMIFRMQEELSRYKYTMILENSHSSPEQEKAILRMAALNQVAGVITMSYSDIYNVMDFAKNSNLVSIERFVSSDVPCISSDNEGGGRIAARKLLEMGKKKILLVERESHHHTGTDLRAQVFEKELMKQKTRVEEFKASLSSDYRQEISNFLKEKFDQNRDVYDGIFAVTDEYALIAKRTLQLIDPELLKDVEIIGFDGARSHEYAPIEIDTIRQPISQIVKEAVEVLLKLIRGDEIKNYRKILPVKFVKAEVNEA